VLAFAPTPLYAGYGGLASRPGGLSALADQQLAAGIMLGPGSIPYAVFVFMALYRWLAPVEAEGISARPRPRSPSPLRRPAADASHDDGAHRLSRRS
jgi:cytochrome c oxidase assembly factor CtaG